MLQGWSLHGVSVASAGTAREATGSFAELGCLSVPSLQGRDPRRQLQSGMCRVREGSQNKRQKKRPPGLVWFMVRLSEPLDLRGERVGRGLGIDLSRLVSNCHFLKEREI